MKSTLERLNQLLSSQSLGEEVRRELEEARDALARRESQSRTLVDTTFAHGDFVPIDISRPSTFDSDDEDANEADDDPARSFPVGSDGGDARWERSSGHHPRHTEASEETAPAPLKIGAYPRIGIIGQGGMGEVYRVRDPDLNRTMVMKVLRARHVGRPKQLARFVEEAQVTAQLDHPGIPPVHQLGRLENGQLYFTMKEVRGRTLKAIIEEVHEFYSGDIIQDSPRGWSLRGLVDTFFRVCETVAYAHARGVIHRDLKPQNIMVGNFGETLVLDWGIARVSQQAGLEEWSEAPEPLDTERSTREMAFTRNGAILGTAGYMSPEQARGELEALGPASDVFSLGAILFEILTGQPAFSGTSVSEVLIDVAHGAHRSPLDIPNVPMELRQICARAMATEPRDRYTDAEALAEAVEAWLEGSRRHESSMDYVRRADALAPRLIQLRAEHDALKAEAARILGELPVNAPIGGRKRSAWQMQDRAADLRLSIARLEAEYVESLRTALNQQPSLGPACQRLASYYRRRHAEAERKGAREEAAFMETHLRAYDDGTHAAYLRGDGVLTLLTSPPGASARLYRYEEQDRRLVPEFVEDLGRTPLLQRTLPMGSYRVMLTHPDCEPVCYPVRIDREGRWAGARAEDGAPVPVPLPAAGALGPGEVFVPAGPFLQGGDERAPGALPGEEVWVDGFIIQRHPVTQREFLAFLNDLVDRGEVAQAERFAPTVPDSGGASAVLAAYERTKSGHFRLGAAKAEPWQLDWPAFLVDWFGAQAYARWFAALTGQPWRLPFEREWEKAARGVDGRDYPWGDYLDPTWCSMLDSHPGVRTPDEIHAHPCDESPYGVRGMAGGVRDWCLDPFHVDHALDDEEAQSSVTMDGDDREHMRAFRGGAWFFRADACRAAARDGNVVTARFRSVGIRLVRPLVGA